MMADGRNNQDPASRVPGNLPLLNTGWGTGEWEFEPGEAFWDHAAKMGADGALTDAMDLAMEGKSAPRVWLILHEPGQPELSAVVALAFARELGGRDQAALVLDCDDKSQALTRWGERVEAEGWIDLARYGTSVLTAGVAMPFAGRRGYFLGVGSFAPTDVTAEEIEQLVKRLRRQADDLILVAPADGIGELWAAAAGIRLLCWDRARRSAAEIEGLVESFAAAGSGLTGLVGFGLPKVEVAAPEAPPTIEEPVAPEEPVVEVPEPVLDDRPDPAIPVPGDDEVDPAPSADDFEAPAQDEAEDLGEDDAGWADAPPIDEPEAKRKNTSGVFWFIASAAVVIVVIMGVFWFKYVRVPKEGHFQPINVAGQGAPVRVPGDRSQGDMANQDDPMTDDVIPSDDPVQAVIASAQAAKDSLPAEAATEIASAATELKTDVPAGKPAVEQAADSSPAVTVAPVEVETATAEPETPKFSMEPYQTTVGSGGWALHLYSFPVSSGADVELAELHRRGFETEVRIVETLEKGRWWRIYVGNFASRAEARAAAPLLKTKLQTDWANPTRF